MPMPTWIRKTLVVMFTILTFGLVTPPQIIIAEDKQNSPTEADILEGSNKNEADLFSIVDPYINELDDESDFLENVIVQAEMQSVKKFGPIIEKKVGDEFREVILPKMEEAIITISNELTPQQLLNLIITDQPTGGTSEKIFHIVDGQTGKDIIRFHVRRDHPPLDGHYFNFHYHTFKDNFQIHHEIGNLFWDKNTPPNWKAS